MVNFHSSPKEGQCQRIFKLLHSCMHFTYQQSNAQNPSIQASTVCETRTSRCTRWISKRQKNQRYIANIHWFIGKARLFHKSIYFWFIDYAKTFDSMDQNTLWKILRDGNTRAPYLSPEKPVYKSRSSNQNWTWNNRLVPNGGRSTSRLYIVTLLI